MCTTKSPKPIRHTQRQDCWPFSKEIPFCVRHPASANPVHLIAHSEAQKDDISVSSCLDSCMQLQLPLFLSATLASFLFLRVMYAVHPFWSSWALCSSRFALLEEKKQTNSFRDLQTNKEREEKTEKKKKKRKKP